MQPNKELFVQRMNAKNQVAYREIFTDFYGALTYYSMSYVQRQDVAEDIVSEFFVRLWESEAAFASYGALTTFLYQSVRNASFDWLKHQSVERKFISDFSADHVTDDPEYRELKEEVFRLLFKAVEELPARSREVFKLYMQGNKAPEIADALGMSVETVRTHRKQALRIIREKMGHMFILAAIFNYF